MRGNVERKQGRAARTAPPAGCCGDGTCAGACGASHDATPWLAWARRAGAGGGAAGIGLREARHPVPEIERRDLLAFADAPIRRRRHRVRARRKRAGLAGSAETTRVARRFSIGGRPEAGQKRVEGYSTVKAAARRPLFIEGDSSRGQQVLGPVSGSSSRISSRGHPIAGRAPARRGRHPRECALRSRGAGTGARRAPAPRPGNAL